MDRPAPPPGSQPRWRPSELIRRHFRLLDFALRYLLRHKWRQIGLFAVHSFVVFLLGSVLLLAAALKHEAALSLASAPTVMVQRMSAGRHALMDTRVAAAIAGIRGVRRVSPRWWGYYYDPPTKATYTFLAAEPSVELAVSLESGAGLNPTEPWGCVIGEGVAKARMLEPGDLIPVKGADGRLYALRITGVFSGTSRLLTHDLILMQPIAWRAIFAVPMNMATDLAVDVSNPDEVETVIRKILERLPDVRAINRDTVLSTYDAVFNWRSGMITLAYSGALAAFLVLSCGRALGLTANETRDLGVLKAVGWTVSDVLELKIWESTSLSVLAFLTGSMAAYGHVFHGHSLVLQPLLQGWSVLFPALELQPHGAMLQLFTVFLLTVVPYVVFTLGPAWRAAIIDPQTALRR